MNKVILLNKRPVGKPALNDFKFTSAAIPVPPIGHILLKTLYVSVDPYLRGRMNDSKSYVPSIKIGKPIQSGIIAEVIDSTHAELKKGDFVSGILEWKEYQVSDGKGLKKVDRNISSLSSYLGILGMTGLTAYLGLIEIGAPKAGDTIVVSGAAGAVGSIVGQIGKILGCSVVGITGTDEKAELLKSKFKFDYVVNYKTATDLNKAIQNACPKGVDIYFDNVGGEISDAVLANINKFARLPVCGTISHYNDIKMPVGPRIQPILLTKSAMMKGFIVGDFSAKFPAAINQLAIWLKEGKLTYAETIVYGFDNIPQAFLDLFDGKNKGKMIVKI
jgi:NADPH-dependent curcumin reductase CurA